MTQHTNTASAAADLPEALRRSTAADGKTELFNLPGYPLMVRAVDFNRIHTESEMRRTALLDEMQKAALAAGQATAAQPGVVYAELPVPNYPKSGGFPGTFAEAQMRAFADATHTLRASHGQAPAQPATVHCKGRNCAAVDGYGHSDECASDHERAASGLDTAGNRNPVARYDGYRGAPCNPAYTKDQRAAWLEGYEARNRQGITPSPQTDNKKKDPL